MNSYRFSCHKNQSTFSKNVNYLFGVSDENFGVSVDNVGVSGMVAVGVSGRTPMMLLSSYTRIMIAYLFKIPPYLNPLEMFSMHFKNVICNGFGATTPKIK